jgi:hypothetical protein
MIKLIVCWSKLGEETLTFDSWVCGIVIMGHDWMIDLFFTWGITILWRLDEDVCLLV